jgi:hypothetical protein
MKTVLYYFTFFLMLLSCKDKQKTEELQVATTAIDTVQETPETKPTSEVSLEDKLVCVTNRAGAKLYDVADKNSEVLATLDYGEEIYDNKVIHDDGIWVEISRTIQLKNDDSTNTRNFFLLKKDLGKKGDLSLIQSDLNVILNLTEYVENDTVSSQKNQEYNKYLQLDLINRSAFDAIANSRYNLFIVDTLKIKSKNDKLLLPIKTGFKTMISKPNEEENRVEYFYLGQYPELNQYVIRCDYYESQDYKFIDKTTGLETQSFIDFPFLNSSKTQILAIYGNPYEDCTDVELFQLDKFKNITKKNILSVFSASYKNWMPIQENQMSWKMRLDNSLEIPVHHTKGNWNKPNIQYLRIQTSIN